MPDSIETANALLAAEFGPRFIPWQGSMEATAELAAVRMGELGWLGAAK